MATIGFSKVFILDKYFTELQKFWETEKKLQDASSSNEAAHLQQRLKSLSSELVTLRNRLHVNGNGPGGVQNGPPNPTNGLTAQQHTNNINNNHNNNNGRPQIPPHAILPNPSSNGDHPHHHHHHPNNPNDTGQPQPTPTGPASLRHHQILSSSSSYHNKPLPPQPVSNNGTLNSHLSNGSGGSCSNNAVNGGGSSGGSSNNGYYVNQNFQKDVMRATSAVGVVVVDGTPNTGSNHSSENGKLGVHVVGGIGSSNGTLGGGSAGGGTSVNGMNGGGSSGSVIGTTTSGGDATQSESSFRLSTKSGPVTLSCGRRVSLADTEDLIHLSGPLTEDALIRCLQARCAAAKYFTYMGHILLTINPLNDVGNPLTLTSTKEIIPSFPIQKVVQEALRQQGDTGYPQAIILSGCSGSGKTYTSMLVLKQLFELAGGGMETDAFKHLTASVTVIRSLGTARTASNRESSRIGHFIEVQVTDGTVYRTKVHCYFLDQTRVVRTRPDESNYHIFYQMMAGLTAEEREKLHLGDHSVDTLRYLKSFPRLQEDAEDAKRFFDWKAALGVLGIPYLDVVRVLAAVILLGNVQFVESSSCLDVDVEVKGEKELQAAASLLGVSEAALRQGLTTRTHNARNQLVRSRCDANLSNFTRDALAKSLYCRTVATIVRRANSLKRLCSTSGTLSSDSADSAQNQAEVASQHASTVGTAGSRASKSMTALNNAVRHATDGFIGILDMFGFEDVKPSHLEHLCINLCAETMQHFYNTHIFKACIESCRDEGIHCDWEVDYVDNVPCIDLISSLRTGLLSMLDVECSVRGTVESYIQKVKTQHKQNLRLLETKSSDLRSFAIQHYSSKVQYDATDFLDTNRDVIADDLVAVFHKHRCSFGFASHLFSSELKILGAGGMEPSPRGISFRISPTSHSELLNGDEPVSTLTQDFHTRLDNLLRTLVHAKPHFIRCIKINNNEQPDLFDRHTVSKQLRAFQVLETVNLMAYGYPHRMRFKAFNARYRSLALFHQLSRTDDRAIEDCQVILECFENSIDGCTRERLGHISISWAVGKRHIFLSEGARQQLEALRTMTHNRAATLIQSTWRGWRCRRRWPIVRQGYHMRFQQMPPPVPPPNAVASTAMSNPKSNGLMTARSTSHHDSMGHAIITSTSFLNTVSHPMTNNNQQNGPFRGHTSTSLPHIQQQISPPGGPIPSHFNDLPQNGKGLKFGGDGPLPTSSHSDNSISSIPVPAPRTGSMGTQLSSANGGISLNSAKSLPNIPPPRSNSNASGAAVSPVSGGEGSCNSSNSAGGLGYPPSNPPGSVCSSTNASTGGRPRPQPIAGTPPPEAMDRCDPKLVQQTCSMFGLDMERPPPLPPSRSYTVAGNTKLGYPQSRIMKMTYPDESTTADMRLMKGEKVVVVGASSRRGHLMVEHKNRTIHVPFQYLELKTAAPE
ncbi:unnamed protein product [Orchesella dallaii]|uniref:Myosin motor domain-containing protein n=1 Tax=Orchesella dallaii TaxID=48710 RepID=A0ABP1R818_9HEXA